MVTFFAFYIHLTAGLQSRLSRDEKAIRWVYASVAIHCMAKGYIKLHLWIELWQGSVWRLGFNMKDLTEIFGGYE